MKISGDRLNRWLGDGGFVIVARGECGMSTYSRGDAFNGPEDRTDCGFIRDGGWVKPDTFMAATHPPIPEGYEQVGEWRKEPQSFYASLADGVLTGHGKVVLLDEFTDDSPYFCPIKKKAPPVPVTKEGIPLWVGMSVYIDGFKSADLVAGDEDGEVSIADYLPRLPHSEFRRTCRINLDHKPTALMLASMCVDLAKTLWTVRVYSLSAEGVKVDRGPMGVVEYRGNDLVSLYLTLTGGKAGDTNA